MLITRGVPRPAPSATQAAKPKTAIKVGQLSAYIHAGKLSKQPALASASTAAAAGDGAGDIADGTGGEDDDNGAEAIEETVVKSGVLLKVRCKLYLISIVFPDPTLHPLCFPSFWCAPGAHLAQLATLASLLL